MNETMREIAWRANLVYLLFAAFGIAVVARVVYLQFWQGDVWILKAEQLSQAEEPVLPSRGQILAEDGRLLAASVPLYELRMDLLSDGLSDQVFSQNVDSLAFCLAEAFPDKTAGQYLTDLLNARREGSRYHLLRRDLSYDELQKAKGFPILRLGPYKGGIIVEQRNTRVKPNGDLASRTVGYVLEAADVSGVGLEGAYDAELRGEPGMRHVKRLPGGIWVPDYQKNQVDPKDGLDIVTTINLDFQSIAHQALLRQASSHRAEWACAVVMEVATGDVKAIVNLSLDTVSQEYKENYNHAIGTATEPGSTFKLASMMVALEDGVVDLDDTIDTGRGSRTFPGDFTIRDTKPGGYGKISAQHVFEVSSNVGVASIIQDNYQSMPTRFVDRLYAMGLNSPLGIEFEGEGSPHIKYPGDSLWWNLSPAQMSLGYELRLTPLQTLAFYNAVANGGRLVRPRFVKEVRQLGTVVRELPVVVLNNSISSSQTIQKAQRMLLGVVENGTASNIRNEHFSIAGKTGTAQVADRNEGYRRNGQQVSYLSSFCGYFPADRPKYSCVVVVSNPSGNYYGSAVAAPVFKEIAEKLYVASLDILPPVNASPSRLADMPYSTSGYRPDLDRVLDALGVPVRQEGPIATNWVRTSRQDDHVLYTEAAFPSARSVPSVMDMGAMDAVYLLESVGLKVVLRGRGRVRAQSLEQGTQFSPGQAITIELG